MKSNASRFQLKPWICIGCGLKQSGKKSSCGTCGRLKIDQVRSPHKSKSFLETLYDQADRDEDGVISRNDFQYIYDTISSKKTPGAFEEVFEEFDSNKDGFLSMEEFKNLMTLDQTALKSIIDEDTEYIRDSFVAIHSNKNKSVYDDNDDGNSVPMKNICAAASSLDEQRYIENILRPHTDTKGNVNVEDLVNNL